MAHDAPGIFPVKTDASGMFSGTDILGNGIQEINGPVPQCADNECKDKDLKCPIQTDTNFDRMTVGNDYAWAWGDYGWFPFSNKPAKATNNLEIKKNQQVGPCESCCKGNNPDSCSACKDACLLANIDQVRIGDRTALAFGNAEATNNEKIVLNQAP
jgi:hypothetical protein